DLEDIYAQRLTSGGAVLWPVNGAPVDTSARTQAALRMCSDGGGGAFFANTYDNQHGLDLEATHLDGSAVRRHQDFLNGGGNGVLIEELGPVLQQDDGGGFFAI